MILRGQAQIGDGVQDVLGADAAADLAAGRRGIEQCPQGGPEPLHEIAGQGGERRVTRMQGRGESMLGGEELGVPLQPLLQRLIGGARPSQLAGGAGAGVDLVLKHGLHKVRALREVPVHRADPDAG